MKVTHKEIEATKEEIRCIEGQIEDLRGNIWSKMYDLVKKRVGSDTVKAGGYEIRCNPELEMRSDPEGTFFTIDGYPDSVMYKVFEALFEPIYEVEDQR